MSSERSRRRALGVALAGAVLFSAGCQNNEIPLIEFPKGAPPMPVSKVDPKGPQGVNTSQGDPSNVQLNP